MGSTKRFCARRNRVSTETPGNDTKARNQMFEMSSYHVLMAMIGASIILSYWMTRFIAGWDPAASTLLTLSGLVSFAYIPGMPPPLDPLGSPEIWERTSELAVVIALFGTGLRIDNVGNYKLWQPAIRLLAITMPLTIAAVAFLGWALAGMTVAGCILLGAVLAPTDPVLAGDVQIGPPLEGGEHPVRFALTTEAGLNDGLAFPFVYLGIIIADQGVAPSEWGLEWLARDVVYRIIVGVIGGTAVGWLLSKLLFQLPRGNTLAKAGTGVIAIAGALLCYGATELVEGYGFVAAFVAGVVLRREEAGHTYHQDLHIFSEAIEHTLSAIILFALGSTLPQLLPALTWQLGLVGLSLVFIIRPATAWVALIATEIRGGERAVVAFYGVRGIGSIYYLGYAASQVQFWDEAQLWATIAFTVLVSTIAHGLTAGFVVRHVTAVDKDMS
jgi:NhaP-type Na+/H+ or K+/H+ antiporter